NDDDIALGEGVCRYLGTDRKVSRVHAELLHDLERLALQVSQLRLVHARLLLVLECDLHGRVAVSAVGGLNLGHDDRTRVNHGTGEDFTLVIKDLGHTSFASENEFHGQK